VELQVVAHELLAVPVEEGVDAFLLLAVQGLELEQLREQEVDGGDPLCDHVLVELGRLRGHVVDHGQELVLLIPVQVFQLGHQFFHEEVDFTPTAVDEFGTGFGVASELVYAQDVEHYSRLVHRQHFVVAHTHVTNLHLILVQLDLHHTVQV